MAAGLGFKTFTTGEVLTAADVNGYLMQGVLVFASAAARNAAITSPQEGQFAFTKDTNGLWYYDGAAWVASGATGDIEGVTAGTGISGGGTSGTVTITNSMATEIAAKGDLIVGTGAATFDNLPVGSNSQILVADNTASTGLKWATPASGAGLTLISKTSFSTQTAQSFNGVFTSTYDNYKIIMTTFGSADQNMKWNFRASGTDNTSANYYYAIWGAAASTGSVTADNNGSAQTSMIFAGNNNSAQRQLISMDVINPMSTTSTKGILYNFVRSRTAIFGGNGYGLLDVAGTAFDGFTITPNSGNTSGTVYIYGWSN
jgi:hypothetical protein